MKRKLAMLMSVIFVSFAFYSCLDYSLPEKIGLEVEGSYKLPVRIASSSWGSILANTLKESFSGGMGNGIGMEVYNVNYGQDVQTFCVYMPMEISNSLNPGDYLGNIPDLLTKLETQEPMKIEESIKLPSFDNFDLINQTISIPAYGETFPPINISKTEIKLGVSGEFLHALIEEGYITISLDVYDEYNNPAGNQISTTYNITISQDIDNSSPGKPYNGFNNPTTNITSDNQSLKDHNINKNPINVSGTVTITNTGGTQLTGKLIIKMNITKFATIDWDFRNIANKLNNPAPVSLAEAAEYLNWLEFDKCDDNPEKGIGINMHFDEIINGLEMTINCNDLSINERKALKAGPDALGNNVFGNKDALEGEKKLLLADPENENNSKIVKALNFDMELHPSGSNKDVLQLTNLASGEELKIKGEAQFFQNWVKAEVNMINALNNAEKAEAEDMFEGKFPNTDKGEKAIDLSMLNDYLEGFKFSGIKAAAYLSGPNESIKEFDPSLIIEAQYTSNKPPPPPVMDQKHLILQEKHIVIKDNPVYLDEKGSYKSEKLPDGNPIEFVDVINAMPEDLVFQYNIKLPDAIIVTPAMFVNDDDESIANNIQATIMLLIKLELTAGDEVVLTGGGAGGRIRLPMFDDQTDLLGRNPDENDPDKPEQDSMFTSLKVSYIKFAVDFASAFFAGGTFYLEKDGDMKLFPRGIPVNSRKLAVNITRGQFDIIKNYFIYPDFRLEFKKDGKITIPRNIGVTSVKIEAKGKNSIYLDF